LRQAVIGRPTLNNIERTLASASPSHLHAADVGVRLAAIAALAAGTVAVAAALAEDSSERSSRLARNLGLPIAFLGLTGQGLRLAMSLLDPGPLSRHALFLRQLNQCPEGAARLLAGVSELGEPTLMAGLVRAFLDDASAIEDLNTIAAGGSHTDGNPRSVAVEQALRRLTELPATRQLRAALQPFFYVAERTEAEIEELKETFGELSTSLLSASQDAGSPASLDQQPLDERHEARQRWGVGDTPIPTGSFLLHNNRLQALAASIYLHEDLTPSQRLLLSSGSPITVDETLQLLTRPEAVAAHILPAQPSEADVIAHLRALT
jgi:hypothetical protein